MRIRFKRHYPLLVLLVLTVVLVPLLLGEQRIAAYTVPGGRAVQAVSSYTNEVGLWDDTVVHSIQVLIAEDDYQQMVTTYQETGAKDYVHADVIIDGVRVNDVGVRLKGNASLRTALGGRGGWGGDDPRMQPGGEWPQPRIDPGNMPGGAWPRPPVDPANRPQRERPAGPGEGPVPPGEGEMPAWPGGQMPDQGAWPVQPGAGPAWPAGGGVSEGQVGKVPLLIRFDKFVDGQQYQGHTRLAIRTYGISRDEAMLQEPVTNAVLRALGQPATRTAYAGVRINDGAEELYVLSEVIDENYLAQHFANANGVLYKADVGANLNYQGEDPSAYAARFTQQTRVNDADMAPLIAFMRFLAEADDAAFEAELPAYLDVEAFAAYLAVNNLLVNTDSLVGMGNNYYMYYDDVTGRFTLLMWDANESLGKLSMGGQGATMDLYYANQEVGGGGGRRMGGPGGMGGSSNLVTRFLATPTFRALYEDKVRQVYQAAFVDGAMAALIERHAALVRAASVDRGLVALADYNAAVEQVFSFIAQRGAYLAATALLGGEPILP